MSFLLSPIDTVESISPEAFAPIVFAATQTRGHQKS
jgi:hypothetical protein